MPEITKIVLTGGPCAGKSTAMSKIQEEFTRRGYRVLFVPETATELITGGISPSSCGSGADFQNCLLQLQMQKETVYEQAAATMNAEKVLIVCDRGNLDNKAYMSDAEFDAILSKLKTSEVALRDRYDAVFHLETAAKGAREFYTTANNAARTETPEEAIRLDDKIKNAWVGHPHLRVIDNATSFDDKMKRLVQEICGFLGEPEPFEIERKFLIEAVNREFLEMQPNCQKVEICQTYLTSDEGDEVRVRRRGLDGDYMYFRTTKRAISAVKRLEVEKRLTLSEYELLLKQADSTRHPLKKTRYCLMFKGHYLEIDFYPFWEDKAIVEVELLDEKDQVEFPEWITVIREVTEDMSYRNSELAKI